MKNNTVKKLCVCALYIAIAFVVNNFVFKFKMPYGGSATFFSMLMIFLPAYFYGAKVGVMAAVGYGLLDLAINPYIVHPVQLLLDYPIAFGLIGIGGILNKSKNGLYTGYLLGITGRFIASTISGAVFLGEFAPAGMNYWLYSAVYNGSYIYAEGVATLVVLAIPAVYKAVNRIKTTANSR